MIPFTAIMREIDAELKTEWQGGAFAWADRNFGNIHANSVDRFDRAISECTERCDWVSLRAEAEVYKSAMLQILRDFKASKKINEQESFLESLRHL